MTKVVIGIDLGTSGARAIAADLSGVIHASADAAMASCRSPDGRVHEQAPEEWWARICEITRQVAEALGIDSPGCEISGVAVTSTSGSLTVVSGDGTPLRPCMLYDDGRADTVLDVFRSSGVASVNASYSIAKAVWIMRNEPGVLDQVKHVLSPADWLSGKLTGRFGVADYSNALKLGYDIGARNWGAAAAAAGIPAEWLPLVVAPGSVVGTVCSAAGDESGLPPGTPVLAGATDGLAGLIASGAAQPGDLNTTLGTTLIWKALSRGSPKPTRSVYCHLHPTGLLAPGAASNTGPGCFAAPPGVSLRDLDRTAEAHLPCRTLCYMLPGVGERFPLDDPSFQSFTTAALNSSADSHAARLQSIAFIERWGYEVLAECGLELSNTVYSTGGAAASPILSTLRASVLGKRVARAATPFAAFGAAILAAGGTHFAGDFHVAITSMTKLAAVYEPESDRARAYDDLYGMFRTACRSRGGLP